MTKIIRVGWPGYFRAGYMTKSYIGYFNNDILGPVTLKKSYIGYFNNDILGPVTLQEEFG